MNLLCSFTFLVFVIEDLWFFKHLVSFNFSYVLVLNNPAVLFTFLWRVKLSAFLRVILFLHIYCSFSFPYFFLNFRIHSIVFTLFDHLLNWFFNISMISFFQDFLFIVYSGFEYCQLIVLMLFINITNKPSKTFLKFVLLFDFWLACIARVCFIL